MLLRASVVENRRFAESSGGVRRDVVAVGDPGRPRCPWAVVIVEELRVRAPGLAGLRGAHAMVRRGSGLCGLAEG